MEAVRGFTLKNLVWGVAVIGIILFSLQPVFHPAIAHAANCINAQGQAYTSDKCSGSESSTDFGFWIAQIIYVFTVGLGSVIATFAAGFLSFAVQISLDSSAYGLTFVSLGWTMLRDIANMAFIFILVYIAVKVMLEANTAGTMGLLAKVLAVALVINFSFFATRVVIDAGNLLSVQFYNAIVKSHDSGSNFVLPFGVHTGIHTPDITGSIMQGINFVSVIGPDSFKQSTASGDGALDWLGNFVTSLITFSFLYIALGAALFMLAAAFITAGVKFIIRIVMLWFAIITAPLALVAWTFQGGGHGAGGHGGGYFSQWRKNLISHAFYPAVFLFVLFLISQFMSAQGDGGFGGGLIQEAAGQGGISSIIPAIINVSVRLAFVLVMLYFALKAGDYFEVFGSKVATQLGNTFSFGGLTGYRRGLDFVNNTVGPKRWAGGLDNQLKQGRLRDIGNTVPGFMFRQAVTKPISELKLKDMESRPEYVARVDKEKKERDENRKHGAEHDAEHGKEGPEVEAREQARYRAAYEGGGAAFDSRVNELTNLVRDSKEETARLARVSTDTMTRAQRIAHEDSLRTNKNLLKTSEGQLKNMVNMGQRIVEARNKEHAKEIAIRLIASGKAANYAVGKKILVSESKESKLAKAVKDYGAEEGEGAANATHAAPTAGGGDGQGGGAPAGAPTPGGHGPAVPPSTH